MVSPAITVASLEEAEELLKGDPEASLFPKIVSISNHKKTSRPSGLDNKKRDVLRLTFDDVDTPHSGLVAPSRDDVVKILEFANNNVLEPRLLVHCLAGISRSTASAILMNMVWLGNGNEDIAVQRVAKSIDPDVRTISPNLLIIKLGDELLGCGGKLTNVVAEFNKQQASRTTGSAYTW